MPEQKLYRGRFLCKQLHGYIYHHAFEYNSSALISGNSNGTNHCTVHAHIVTGGSSILKSLDSVNIYTSKIGSEKVG